MNKPDCNGKPGIPILHRVRTWNGKQDYNPPKPTALSFPKNELKQLLTNDLIRDSAINGVINNHLLTLDLFVNYAFPPNKAYGTVSPFYLNPA